MYRPSQFHVCIKYLLAVFLDPHLSLFHPLLALLSPSSQQALFMAFFSAQPFYSSFYIESVLSAVTS